MAPTTAVHVNGPDHRTRVLHFVAPPTASEIQNELANRVGIQSQYLHLTSQGRPLNTNAHLSPPTVMCSVRVLGGGGDGGSFMERRDCCPHIKEKKAEPKKPDALTVQRMLWSVCKLTNDALGDSIMADELGYLYAADSILQRLMAKRTDPSSWPKDMAHVARMSDLIKVKLTPNPHYKEGTSSIFVSDTQNLEEGTLNKWSCPLLTDITTNGANKFATFKTCGHVVSMKAVAAESGVEAAVGSEVKPAKTGVCPVCQAAYVTRERHMEAVNAGEANVCENILIPLAPLPDSEEVKNWKEFRIQQKKKRKTEDGKEGNGKGGEKKAKKQKADKGGSKVTPTVSRNAPPPGASADVWKQVFHDKNTKPQEPSFLVRAGMKSFM